MKQQSILYFVFIGVFCACVTSTSLSASPKKGFFLQAERTSYLGGNDVKVRSVKSTIGDPKATGYRDAENVGGAASLEFQDTSRYSLGYSGDTFRVFVEGNPEQTSTAQNLILMAPTFIPNTAGGPLSRATIFAETKAREWSAAVGLDYLLNLTKTSRLFFGTGLNYTHNEFLIYNVNYTKTNTTDVYPPIAADSKFTTENYEPFLQFGYQYQFESGFFLSLKGRYVFNNNWKILGNQAMAVSDGMFSLLSQSVISIDGDRSSSLVGLGVGYIF